MSEQFEKIGSHYKGLRTLQYVGIDQSYSGTGIAVISGLDTRKVKYWEFKAGTTRQVLGERLNILTQSLFSIFPPAVSTKVCMEGGALDARYNTFMLGALYGALMHELWRRGYKDILIVPPKSMKKFVAGSGAATKEEVATAIKEKWGFGHPSDNVTDAYGLCRMCISRDTGEYIVPPDQSDSKRLKRRRKRGIPDELTEYN